MLCVVVFFTLTDRASTIPSIIRGCQSGTWSTGQEKDQRNILSIVQSSNESMKTKTKTRQKRPKERNNNTKHMPEKNVHHRVIGSVVRLSRYCVPMALTAQSRSGHF